MLNDHVQIEVCKVIKTLNDQFNNHENVQRSETCQLRENKQFKKQKME